jgi:hypothetical protein
MSIAVQDILKRIEQLSEEDRQALESCLAARAEAEWKNEAEQARRQARDRNLTQEQIDRSIEQMRYGP